MTRNPGLFYSTLYNYIFCHSRICRIITYHLFWVQMSNEEKLDTVEHDFVL